MSEANGTVTTTLSQEMTPEQVQDVLSKTVTEGYKPTLPIETFFTIDGLPLFQFRRDIEMMIPHPFVHTGLEYFKSGIAGAEFDIKTDRSEIGEFVLEQCKRYWDRGVPLLQESYPYGWIGAECKYAMDDFPAKWESLTQFAPRDTWVLTQDHHPVGVRVKQVVNKGNVDLFMARGSTPAKGLWYAHNPRWGMFYGRSQIWAAWRPWRRLAYKDGAESVLDMGVYRQGFPGPIIGYPDEDYQAQPGTPGTTPDSQGRPRRWGRDIARQIVEQAKTGASVGLPTTRYPMDRGGHPKWTIEWPTTMMNIAPALEYIKHLADQIFYGIGVPPELIQAAETGSGYSGRAIPMEAFLDGQQRIADAFLTLFVEQVLKPLVEWNWGPGIKFEVKVKRLLETKNAARAGQPGGQQPIGPSVPEVPGQGIQFSNNPLITDRIRDISRKAIRRLAA